MTERITFVTVVFEPELLLLELQAMSLARWLDPAIVERVIVLDNTANGMRSAAADGLRGMYGPFADRVDVLRPSDLGPTTLASGWRAQQALKLLVAERVDTAWYVTLDAKTHLIEPTTLSDFFASPVLPHGGFHSYLTHPLLPQLTTVLQSEGLDPDAFTARFTSTATPFVLRTGVVRELLLDVGSRNPDGFAAEFERARLTEFFLYTAWQLESGAALDELHSGQSLESRTVWPKLRSAETVAEVLDEADAAPTTTAAVHRTALARMDRDAVDLLAGFWTAHELFASTTDAKRFIARFRRRYYPAMLRKKARERLSGVRS